MIKRIPVISLIICILLTSAYAESHDNQDSFSEVNQISVADGKNKSPKPTDSYDLFIENAIQWAKANQHRTDYRLKCLAFVEDAYEISNSIEMFGGDCASESADMYSPLNGGLPEKGALVFFHTEGTINNIHKDWGHVGLAIGDGKNIHTWSTIRIDNFFDLDKLQNAPGWSKLEYRGWIGPEVFLKGYINK